MRLKSLPLGPRTLERPARHGNHRIKLSHARCLIAVAAVTLTLLGPLSGGPARAALPPSIQLTPSLASPQPVGTSITWTATASDTVPLLYRFSAGPSATGPFTLLRDFSPHNTFTFAPLQDGVYYIQVTIEESYGASATASTVTPFTITSPVNGTTAAVSPTANPLVALYSAPACSHGLIEVRFRQVGTSAWTYTDNQVCVPGFNRNFLVAGMLPNTTYEMQHILYIGFPIASPSLFFTTGSVPSSVKIPTYKVVEQPRFFTDTAEPITFHGNAPVSPNNATSTATDLSGRLLWYNVENDLRQAWAVRLEDVGIPIGNVILMIGNDGEQQNGYNVLRVTDMAGDPMQETNVQQVNQQLPAHGITDTLYGFHHDALYLPNGNLAVIGATERVITTTPVMGDMLIVLDKNMQVTWAWDAFDHLDPNRGPTLGETCGTGDPPGFCPVPGGPSVIDWLHTNAISWSPQDQNIILSMRHQDWLVKINYSNGHGDGSVMWRLGKDGDFTIVPANPSDPYPWFSHQHDAHIVDATGSTLILFDNGNTRCAVEPQPCYSRGQVYHINEQTKVVIQTLNVSLGNYSGALGVAERLSNGNYDFTSGFQFGAPSFGQEIEVSPYTGSKLYVQQSSAIEYRAWRLTNLYQPTDSYCLSAC